jgi:hypothetical protein
MTDKGDRGSNPGPGSYDHTIANNTIFKVKNNTIIGNAKRESEDKEKK